MMCRFTINNLVLVGGGNSITIPTNNSNISGLPEHKASGGNLVLSDFTMPSCSDISQGIIPTGEFELSQTIAIPVTLLAPYLC